MRAGESVTALAALELASTFLPLPLAAYFFLAISLKRNVEV